MTRKPGRPLGTAKPGSRRIKVPARFTDEEYARYKADADAQVLTLADWIRACCELGHARGSVR